MLTRIAGRTHLVWTACSFRNACFSLIVRALYLIFFKGWKRRPRPAKEFPNGSLQPIASLIAGGKLRSHAQRRAQFPSRGNRLNALLFLERALLMMVGQTPARLDAEKWPAIGPATHIQHASEIHAHPS